MMAVAITGDDVQLNMGSPVKLFEANVQLVFPQRHHDIGPDGRFLVVLSHTDSLDAAIGEQVFPDRIRVATDWFAELRRKFGQ